MSLHRRIASIGSLTGKTVREIASVCGKPARVREREFSDIGGGTQAVWRTPLFSFCLNFDREERCCGVEYVRDLVPHVLVLTISVMVVASAVLLIRFFGG